MKSRTQKQEELKKAETLLSKSKALLFFDFNGIETSFLRELRKTARGFSGSLMIIKKRLLNVLFKDKEIEYDTLKFDGSVATIFTESSYEEASGPFYKFFAALPETETRKKADNIKKILGGYDMRTTQTIDAATIVTIGQLPPREVLLGHVLGAIAAPLRAFMYLLQEKARIGGSVVAGVVVPEETKETTPVSAEITSREEAAGQSNTQDVSESIANEKKEESQTVDE